MWNPAVGGRLPGLFNAAGRSNSQDPPRRSASTLPNVSFLDFLFTFDDPQTTSTNATDVSAHARNMTLLNAPTSVAGAPPGTAKARNFTSAASQEGRLLYTLADNTAARNGYINNDAPGADWTMTGFVYLPSAQATSHVMLASRSNVGFGVFGYYIGFAQGPNKAYWSANPAAGNAINLDWDTQAWDDAWHDIVLTKAAGGATSDMNLYWDGALLAAKQYTSLGGPNEWGPGNYMAVNAITGAGFYDSRVQNASLWTTVFTAAQASTWHTLRTTGVKPKTYLGL